MRAFYGEKKIDIFKDAVFLLGVSMSYFLNGAFDRGTDLWSLTKEAYKLLKTGMVGGSSIVFKRYYEVGFIKIRLYRFKVFKICVKIVGYDANALYLSIMVREMSAGKGIV